MPTHTHDVTIRSEAGVAGGTATVSASAEVAIEETVPDSSTDMLVNVPTIQRLNLKSFVLLSDQDVTVKTNSSSTPDNTWSLKANIPLTWMTGRVESVPLAADITALYVTNNSGAAAEIKLRALQDATP